MAGMLIPGRVVFNPHREMDEDPTLSRRQAQVKARHRLEDWLRQARRQYPHLSFEPGFGLPYESGSECMHYVDVSLAWNLGEGNRKNADCHERDW